MGNFLVASGSPYTLRRTPVTPVVARAREEGRKIVNGLLGDPVAHGLAPYEGFSRAVSSISLQADSWGYTDSLGNPGLRQLIKQVWLRDQDVQIFLGAGVSGVMSEFMRWALTGGNRKGVLIPEATYILYFFHTAINGGNVQKIKLTPNGHVDVSSMADSITRDTKIIAITTVGNPLGTAMNEQTAKDIIRIVNSKERELGHPIYLVFDIMYEGFRRVGNELDPLTLAEQEGREGPTIVVDSLSKKKIAAPGARLGWMAVKWGSGFANDKKNFMREMESLFLPGLGQVPTAVQLAVKDVLEEVVTRADGGVPEESLSRFDSDRRATVHARVQHILYGLAETKGIIFPDCYYNVPGDRASGIATDNIANSFYIIFGFEHDNPITFAGIREVENPSAKKLAQFCVDRNSPVIATTPFDSFLPPDDRGRGLDFMRTVALQDAHKCREFLDGIRMYAEFLAQ